MKAEGSEVQQSSMLRHATAFVVVGGCLFAGGGCGGSPSASASATPTIGRGFQYDPAGGEAGFSTIQIGDHVRIFAVVSDWTPATVSLLDEKGAAIRVFRMDLPPGGVIRAEIPELAASDKLQLYFADVRGPFDRKIGVNAPVLTTDRLKEIVPALVREDAGSKRWELAVKGMQTSVKPGSRRSCVVGTDHTFFQSVNVADGAGPLSDDLWLTPKVREAIAAATRPR
jgi:hypothetical protein